MRVRVPRYPGDWVRSSSRYCAGAWGQSSSPYRPVYQKNAALIEGPLGTD